MPAPLLVDDEILVAVEDNKVGQFKPWIVRTLVSENWNTPVLANSSSREYALKDSLPDEIYAGAPYLMQVPSGEVILSYQTTSGRTSDWEMSTLEVAIGDKKGRNFEKLTRPFDVPFDREAKWNFISMWDENTVVAAATTSFRSLNCEVWIILGHLISELKVPPKSARVDGDLSEWEEKFPVFIGSESETKLSAALGYDDQNLTFCAKVTDDKLFYNAQQPQNSDGVSFYIDVGNHNLTEPAKGVFKIECSYKGNLKIWEGNNGEWNEISSDKFAVSALENKSGYQLEMAVPFSLPEKNENSDFRITMGLTDYQDEKLKQVEHIVHSVPESSATWLKAEFLNEKNE